MSDPSDHDPGYGEGSRYAAHIDRGWDLLDQGDVAAARDSAHIAIKLDERAPDALVLLGAIASADGDLDGAIESYELAIGLAPDFIDAHLALAQMWLYERHDTARAGEVCDRALDLRDLLPVDRLELRAMAAEAAVMENNDALARAYLEDQGIADALAHALSGGRDAILTGFNALEGGGLELPDDEELAAFVERGVHLLTRIARVWLDLDAPKLATDLLEIAVLVGPEDADAWYSLSEVHLRAGNLHTSMQAAMRTTKLDASAPLAPWMPGAARLHAEACRILKSVHIEELPANWQDADVPPVLCRDLPSDELIFEGLDPRVPVLLLAHRTAESKAPEVTALVVYRRNLARLCSAADRVDSALRTAILEEFAAVFEFSPERRVKLGLALARGAIAKPPEHH